MSAQRASVWKMAPPWNRNISDVPSHIKLGWFTVNNNVSLKVSSLSPNANASCRSASEFGFQIWYNLHVFMIYSMFWLTWCLIRLDVLCCHDNFFLRVLSIEIVCGSPPLPPLCFCSSSTHQRNALFLSLILVPVLMFWYQTSVADWFRSSLKNTEFGIQS